MLIWTLVVLAAWLPGTAAHGIYRDRIPNGRLVPNPCDPSNLWQGVGHQNSAGGGPRNPFGLDFAKNGHRWTRELCYADSDGDGRTNGQELGDPYCHWLPGMQQQDPARTQGITHPGVCEPLNSPECRKRNSWLTCSHGNSFQCDAIKEPGVLNMTIRFPRTKVPAKETTYICFNFELPDNERYHLVALEPVIDNDNVMHHMVLTGCDDNVKLLSEPEECLMGAQHCRKGLGGWTLGMQGMCYTSEAGFPIGKGSTRLVSLQLHWTNPNEVDTWFDSSGLILYYTPRLRKYNAGTLALGQVYLNIPPGESSWEEEGTCTRGCTRSLLRNEIQVFGLLNHMHYLGIRQRVTLAQPGRGTKVLVDDDPFRYSNPVQHTFDDPISVRAGDQLKTYCTYNSLSRAKTTTYGEGSFDEMCYSFLFMYPVENITSPSCVQWKDIDLCDKHGDCNIYSYIDSSNPNTEAAVDKILDNCDPGGACRKECPGAVKEVMDRNYCLRYAWRFLRYTYFTRLNDSRLMMFASAMESCSGNPTEPTQTTSPPAQTTTEPGTDRMWSDSEFFFLRLFRQLGFRQLLRNILRIVNANNMYNRFPEDYYLPDY